MANVASMGPPPSPKEPRRSGRRSGPSTSTSKSPAGSPTSETGPKPKDNIQKSAPSSSNTNRNKRAKNEDTDDTVDENQKNGVNGTSNGRARRKGRNKEVAPSTLIEFTDVNVSAVDVALGDGNAQEEEEEEQGVTRCICQETGDESEAGEFMAECEICHAWQHGTCMGYQSPETMPLHYYCERCKPDLYTELLKKHAKRARQSSAASHHAVTSNPARTSRSHSPTYLLKQPAKRRNTMNSRDAAYDESLQAVIEASAAEAAASAAAQEVTSPAATTKSEPASNGLVDPEPELENISSGRRKRKRSDDDASSSKRTRSASIVSDLTHGATAAAEPSPTTTIKPALPPMSTTRTTQPRSRRGGGRKAQVAQQQQERMSIEGDNNEAVAGTSSATRRQGNSRSKANNAAHDHGTRRSQANGASGHAATSGIHNAAASRAYHNSHAYAVSQQPLLTSWGLPDYLSHLEQMLPTQTPQPLEVRGFGTISNGQDMQDHTTERGVKVKWPSKRMSVGDMNKRVRALVEWVGREQASAAERTRRREAIEKSLLEARAATNPQRPGEDAREGNPGSPMVLDGGTVTGSPVDELRQPPLDEQSSLFTLEGPGPDPGKSTMRMMEELMEELISFQERFGPGAKVKERDRRTATS